MSDAHKKLNEAISKIYVGGDGSLVQAVLSALNLTEARAAALMDGSAVVVPHLLTAEDSKAGLLRWHRAMLCGPQQPEGTRGEAAAHENAEESEPVFIAQNSAFLEEKEPWFQRQVEVARALGVTWVRYSQRGSEEIDDQLLEGWRERPAHEGSQRWDMEPLP